ncbi:MAG TPA: LytR C-terminal domain-containing protein [Solirubrobacteraceae bacterium]|nr:LytR C-terminal domain-containing protein [Solirubrobacteraceae bacterium]
MVTIPFALSVHHFISSVGADAGFAAFIAVALLVLLYFSQARETATLRRRADEAGQRVQELETELAALADHVAALPAEISVRAAGPRATPAYAGGVGAAPAGVSAGGLNLPPAAPAGVGAPALAAATRLIPGPIAEPQPTPVGLVNGPVEDATQVDGSPVTVGGSNGSSHRPVAAPAATMPRPVQARTGGPSRAGGPPRGAQGRYPGGQGRPRASQGRPAEPPRTMMAVRPGQPRSGVGGAFVILAALLGVGAVVAGVLVIKNINSSSSKTNSASASSAAARTTAASRRNAPAAAVNPRTVTVAVLNGTNTNGLAGKVSGRLDTAGYQKGYVGNFTPNQTQSSTLVQYMPGDKRDASAVATSLKLPPKSVEPLDSATQQIACPPSQGPCKSAVVVTVGSDLSSLATQ